MAPSYSPGMRSLAGLGDSRAQQLAARPGGGLAGKGLLGTLPSMRKPNAANSPRSGAGGRGLGKTGSGSKTLKRSR